MPSLVRISMTPLKGTLIQTPSEVGLTERGIPGNRSFYLVDQRGKLLSGRELPQLVQIRATYDVDREHLVLRMPDGTEITGAADRLGEEETTDFWGRPVRAAVVDGPFADALSAFCSTHLRLLRCLQDSDAVDDEPLTLLSTESVRDLAVRGGYDGELDARRFRMNLEIDGCEPYEEETWGGRFLRVGDATIRIGEQVPRCVFVTKHPETGEKDWNTLRHIAQLRPRIPDGGGLPFGVYASVSEPANVRVGDEVVLLPDEQKAAPMLDTSQPG